MLDRLVCGERERHMCSYSISVEEARKHPLGLEHLVQLSLLQKAAGNNTLK